MLITWWERDDQIACHSTDWIAQLGAPGASNLFTECKGWSDDTFRLDDLTKFVSTRQAAIIIYHRRGKAEFIDQTSFVHKMHCVSPFGVPLLKIGETS